MSSTGTLLLVDDEPNFINLIRQMLEGEGYELIEAASGEQALETYEKSRPDLVLLDVLMTGLNGFETCRRLNATYGDECAPVIFFTSRTGAADIAEGFAAGACDYLAKPCRTNEVRARIRSHLQNHILVRQQKMLVEQLSRANAAKNRFIGMAAHDMRNPLVSIRGFAEFLQDGTVGELDVRQLALVSIIRGTSQLMLDTLNELLDMATIESGELKLQLAPCHFSDLAAKSVALSKIEAAKKRTKIEFAPEATGPVMVIDADKMRQVIENLLSNAVKYSPSASTITARVEISADGQTCSFAVRDQGPGIPEHERDVLFKNFGKLSAEPTLGEKSSGLGLAICRNIVEAHRGTISAENLPEKGCEFRFTLPLTS